MVKNGIASGVAHRASVDLKKFLISKALAREVWNAITPLARNERLCFIEPAKKAEMHTRRIKRIDTNLLVHKTAHVAGLVAATK